MRLTSRALGLGISLAASLAYLFAARLLPLPADVALKGLSVGMLGVIALRERQSFLAAALLLSSLGDVLLELGAGYFLLGLAAFLTSHVIYTVLFIRHRAQSDANAGQWIVPVLVSLYGIGFAAWLAPSLEQLRMPVFCYIAAIVAMAATASRANYRNRRVVMGALLFLISDSLLGTVKFMMPVPWSGFLIWIAYYVGQCGIALGVLDDARAPSA